MIGERNRYCTVHPYLFVAAFLDLCTKKALKKMMVTSEYDSLHASVLGCMVEMAAVKKLQNNGDDNGNLKEKLGKILHFKVCLMMMMSPTIIQLYSTMMIQTRQLKSGVNISLHCMI